MHRIKETKSFNGKEVIGRVPKFRVPKIAKIGVAIRLKEKASIKRVRQKEITPNGNKSARKIIFI